ncbi:Protein UXT-like protein [Hordeum vulgare]|nr:Protein UXT-like protein [Hordeum vulgare]
MRDQLGVGLDLDGFPLDHEFPEDYGLEEEDECDIEAEPLFEGEAANAKTKAKEVALASMMTGVEIMKVDLNTVSPRKRPWFDKMQANMLNFDNE